MKIALIHLGKPVYDEQAPAKVSLTLAVTFEENIVPAAIYLKLVRNDGATRYIEGALNDAKDAFPEEIEASSSQRHWHVLLHGLDCGESYTYEVKRCDRQPIHVMPAFDEVLAKQSAAPHQAIAFKAPPAPGTQKPIAFATAGDTEALDYFRWTQLDNKVVNTARLSFDQRELTAKIYRQMGEKKFDLMLHLADYFNAERFHGLHYRGEDRLRGLRREIAEDHHKTARIALGGTVSAHLSDDHDDLWNGYNAESVANNPQGFQNTRAAVNEFWPVPDTPSSPNPGLYYQLQYGDMCVWFLHTRAYHQPGGTLLGDAQTEWFERTLQAAAKANVAAKIVATPVPFAMGKNPEEDFRGRPGEWDRLLKLMAEYDVTAIFSADTHAYGMTMFKIRLNDERVHLPHYMIGTLGGKPQQMSDKERDKLPQPLIPGAYAEDYQGSEVKAYYSPERLTRWLPRQEKTAFKSTSEQPNGQWVGDQVKRSAYGFMAGEIDFESNEMRTMLWLTKLKTSEKRPYFSHETTVPLKPKRTSINQP